MTGVNYGGHSTRSAAASFNCDTWCCLMGTNDLLSDRGYTPQEFATKMQNLLGGKVTVKGKSYSWLPGEDWGNMGRIAADILKEDTDILYVMAVPCWGNHSNNNEPERHLTVQMYNGLLKDWVGRYAKAHGKNMVFVDVNRGMVDRTHQVPFSWPDSMSNRPGRDGLHPNEQGSMMIASNLAETMGIPGRTAGLKRAAYSASWAKKKVALPVGAPHAVVKEPFSREKGYSVEVPRVMNGKTELELTLGDDSGSGTLLVTPELVCWAGRTLYCFPADAEGGPREMLRVCWHPGMEGNRPQGYYVWLGERLIGQALPAGPPVGNGLILQSRKRPVKVYTVKYTDGSYAPEKS
jgi:hypothetical protein